MLQPLLIAERFGVLDYPRIFSRTQFICIVGTAGGPLLLGWLYDNAGGYETSYLVAAACSLTGALVLASGGPATVRTRDASGVHPNVRRVVAAAAAAGLDDRRPCSSPTGRRRRPTPRRRSASTSAQIVKSLIFAVDGDVVLAYVSGANQLDERKLAAAAGGDAVRPRRRRHRPHRHRLPDRWRAAVRPRHRRWRCSSIPTCSPTTRCGRPPARGTTCSRSRPADLVRGQRRHGRRPQALTRPVLLRLLSAERTEVASEDLRGRCPRR